MTAIYFRFLLTILWELVILVWEFYMLKSNIDVFFCDVISLLARVFILSSNRVSKEVSMKKNWNFSMAHFFVIWLYFQKARYRPCDLDLWPMKVNLFSWIEYNHISILYTFQIDISSNSREIKYQNIGRTHRYTHTHTHTHTQTHTQSDRVKTIPRNPLRGRGNKSEFSMPLTQSAVVVTTKHPYGCLATVHSITL